MKSTVIRVAKEVRPCFPKMMVSLTSGVIIMATSERATVWLGYVASHFEGMVINGGSTGCYSIGDTRDDFIVSCFEDFHGSVLIDNTDQ